MKSNFFYCFLALLFSGILYFALSMGKTLELEKEVLLSGVTGNAWSDFLTVFSENVSHPLAKLLVQLIVIVSAAKFLGYLCRQIGQPSVIGEMIAGILLGPSLLGLYFPELSEALFPVSSLGNLQMLSQIGLILFMFIVGLELDLSSLSSKTNEAVIISHASIVVPFTLGVCLSYFLYVNYAPSEVTFLSFALFMGGAMSITAFPVLARIVQEKNIHKTKLGVMVIACAAVDDITAWCVLAAVIAIVKAGSVLSALYILALAVFYVFFMFKVARPFFARLMSEEKDNLSKKAVTIIFLSVVASAYLTEIIGIHALFGPFLVGVLMPENVKFRQLIINKVEDLSLILLLPLFFAFTGLRTKIDFLSDPSLYKTVLLIVFVAVAGKFLGSALSARFVGQSWKDSLSIGALMNTRGLMELVVLNIGYDLGVLNADIFAMMVIMALVTTFMTGPSLDLINRVFKEDKF